MVLWQCPCLSCPSASGDEQVNPYIADEKSIHSVYEKRSGSNSSFLRKSVGERLETVFQSVGVCCCFVGLQVSVLCE